uniref:Uncharacterized protein n=1 Tax=Schizaphis graminum TaxID=13262 RepID=A0A2S2P5S2_SCHGA
MNNNALGGEGRKQRWRWRRYRSGGGGGVPPENITHPCLTPSPGKRAPCSHPFNSLAGFRIIMRLVAPHNATFQQTIHILYKYWDLSNLCSRIALLLRPLTTRTPYTALRPAARFAPHSCLPILRTFYEFNLQRLVYIS